jgi:hypothetical protein
LSTRYAKTGCKTEELIVKAETKTALLLMLNPAATKNGSNVCRKFEYQSFNACANDIENNFKNFDFCLSSKAHSSAFIINSFYK